MSSVDDRIVNMQFNNKQFQSGAAESQKSLQTLDGTIAGMGKTNGLDQMGKGVDGIKHKFGALQVAGVAALGTLVAKATTAGLNLIKSMTIDPIIAGFKEYETNLNSVQTIMANTGKKVGVVNKYLLELNQYSDQTIYNFSQMADSIGKFTAAGVPIKDATASIKGMANTAALSGVGVEKLNTAMYQMSQALSSGVIRLQDWNSLQQAGMGGTNIQNAIKATTNTIEGQGEVMAASIKKNGTFRDSLRDGWLTADVFNKTMKVMAGTVNEATGKTEAYSVAQLQAMGYTKESAKEMRKLSQASIESATKIKTFTQLMDVVKESIGSGMGQVFQALFGNFKEATKLWTTVGDKITGFVSLIFDNVSLVLEGWRELGGYQALWEGIGNIFQIIGNLMAPFVAAFKSIAPETSKAGSGLAKATIAFADFTGWLEKITRGASALTPVLVTIVAVIKSIAGVAMAAIKGLQPLWDLLADVGSQLGDMAGMGSDISGSIMDGIVKGLDPQAIQAAVTAFAINIVTWIKSALGIASPAAELVPVGLAIAQGIAEGLINGVNFVFEALGTLLGGIFDLFKTLFGDMDALDWASMFNALLVGGLVLSLKKVSDVINEGLSIKKSVVGVFDEMTNTLKTMQTSIKFDILMKIAISVALLTASLVALSLLDPKDIAVGLGAIASMIGMLVGSMALLSKVNPAGLAKISFAMNGMATAMIAMSIAVAIMGSMDMTTLSKGLGAIAIGLGIMVGAIILLDKNTDSIATGAGSILIMSAAMVVLAGAVLAFGSMSLETLGKGLGAVAIAIGIFTGALALLAGMGPSVGLGAGGIVLMAGAMVILAGAVAAFGRMKVSTLAKGLGAVAIAIGIFVAALAVMAALGPMVGIGAGAIVLLAGALAVLVPTILTLGTAPFASVAKGLGLMAIALGIVIAAGYLAIAAAPGLLALGAAVGLLGLGLALAGAGMFLFGTGFALMAATGVAGVAVIMAAIQAFIGILPMIAIQVAAAFVSFLQTIASASTEIREAFGKIFENILGVVEDAIPKMGSLVGKFIGEILKQVTKAIPQFGKLISTLIKTGLDVLVDGIPRYVRAGMAIIVGVLDGLADGIPKIIRKGTDIIIAFIEGMGEAGVRIANATGRTILAFLRGIEAAIDEYMDQIIDAGFDIAEAIAQGLYDGLVGKGKDLVMDAVEQLAKAIPGPIRKIMGIESPSKEARWWGEMIVDGLVQGITRNIKSAVGAAIMLANATIAAGNKTIASAQKKATRQQIAAAKAQAKANLAANQAKEAERFADKNPKNKKAEKRANELARIADRQQAAADKLAARQQAAEQAVADKQAFAAADNDGRGDIMSDKAKELSDRAIAVLAKANAEALAAKKLSGKARKEMLAAAKRDAKLAKRLAQQSIAADRSADAYYAAGVKERIKLLEDERSEDALTKKQQEEFDKATTLGKSEIMAKRAAKNQKIADAAEAKALEYIKQAKKLAKTDAKKAQKFLDMAAAQSQIAEDAAKQAQDESEQAARLAEEAAGGGGGLGGGGTSGSTITPSRSVLEDAASVMDRFSESLAEATELAAAGSRTVVYEQNNYSPEALSVSDVYRNTKNLLSATEIKMGAETD